MDECLKKASCNNWAVNFLPGVKNGQGEIESSYISYFKGLENGKYMDNLVYLTADSENTITDLDPNKVYIIGGIVDRNRYIRLTYDKAVKQGISHAKLPIGDHMKLTSSAVLAVNHVYEILVEQYHLKDWAKTLAKVIPERKIQNEENEEKARLKAEKKRAVKEHFKKIEEQRNLDKQNKGNEVIEEQIQPKKQKSSSPDTTEK